MSTRRMYGIGVAALLPEHEPMTLAPRHPAAHPGFGLAVETEDGRVVVADPQPGLMHRSAEKLLESRDWRQGMSLADRHDWLSSISSEIGMALTYEEALGITPPARATWIRTLLAETNRVAVALAFLAPVAGSARNVADELRERLISLQESVTGARMHPAFVRIGGVAGDLDDDVLTAHVDVLADVTAAVPRLSEAVASYADSLSGVGVLTGDEVVAWGLSGPVARASGWDRDLRRDEPYLAYADVAHVLAVPVRSAGDVPSRYAVLAEQVPVSVDIALACVEELRRLGDGPVDVPLPKVVRIPEGMTYVTMEGPIGITGCLLVGDGDKYPLRLKLRSASFATLQALGPALVGTPEDEIADVVMSMPVILGDVDR